MSETRWRTNSYITSWKQFNSTSYRQDCQLLARLDEFPESILVTGCQRSGTTILSRVLNRSDGLTNYWFGPDDELDAALILSGHVEHQPKGRYCFQTTYVNACYREYFRASASFKMVWVLRTPFSVIHSMLYNWRDEAIDMLFGQCAIPALTGLDEWRYRLLGINGISRLRRACWAYAAKTRQIFEIMRHLSPDQLMLVDYDELVTHKQIVLPAIYGFVNLSYAPRYADEIHAKSIDKKGRLSAVEIATIQELCEGIYQEARKLLADKEPPFPTEGPPTYKIARSTLVLQAATTGEKSEVESAVPGTFLSKSEAGDHSMHRYRNDRCQRFLRMSLEAFLLEDTKLGQQCLRHAVQEDRSILDGAGKRYRAYLIRWHLSQGDREGHVLERIFRQLPPELAWLSEYQAKTVGSAFLYRGAENVISKRFEEASASFTRARELGAELDPIFADWLFRALLQHEKEFGPDRTREVLDALVVQLQSLSGNVDGQSLAGRYLLKRAFQRYRECDYAPVPVEILRAIKAQPRYLANRGVWAVLLRSLFHILVQG